MKLAARFWLWGALVPATATLLALVGAGQVFRTLLEESVDRALLAQAAVESVSLFDGPEGRPHLHMARSPLLDQVRPFAPWGALYAPDGSLEVQHPHPDDEGIVAPAITPAANLEPELRPRRGPDGTRLRDLTVGVDSAQGRYTLRLTASLAQTDQSIAAFRRVTLAMALAIGLALLAIQGWQARRLARRLGALGGHMARLREGDLESRSPQDPGRDEIAELSAVVGEATDRLREARQAQERLVAEAAHELRTPLALLRTQMDLALRRERPAEELREALEEAREEVQRLAALASHLLDLAAAGRGAWDRRPVDLAEIVTDSVEAARAEAEARDLLIRWEPQGTYAVLGDAGALRQAVDNLLSNAIKFSPRGATIGVRVSRQVELVRVVVTDEGPGIPQAERETIFAPFHRLGGAAPGAGLGLAIVREIATRHGGRAFVADGEAGAELVLELPKAA